MLVVASRMLWKVVWVLKILTLPPFQAGCVPCGRLIQVKLVLFAQGMPKVTSGCQPQGNLSNDVFCCNCSQVWHGTAPVCTLLQQHRH